MLLNQDLRSRSSSLGARPWGVTVQNAKVAASQERADPNGKPHALTSVVG